MKTIFHQLLFLAVVLTPSEAIASDVQASRKPLCTSPVPSQFSDPHLEESEASGWAAEVQLAINRPFRETHPIERAVHCHLLVNADGSIRTARIVKSSGDPKVDQRALDFLKGQVPLPKPRNSLARQTGLRIWFKPEFGKVDVLSEAWLKREHPGK
ncbi:MAG TPA: energy transducer TonB [Candidatus Obscuribacter sp.]|nr:energy transducer TonB [Candidatus Obscuribacter sp.]HND67111.1 energy transducer TonB [Candidatus Obscuribacter sp.]HNG20361.1 energy transducer TonB [Candidatus Obscuribacter sp.]HNG76274.1 energy transducer TonB [Candidatus Obscuribacter sp.]HNH73812.1 energy transducer TonB [Candidatus Obscuribacter sp.]